MKLFQKMTQLFSNVRVAATKQEKYAEAVILHCHKTGKISSAGIEIKLLLHVKPFDGRSFVHEYTSFHSIEEIDEEFHVGKAIAVCFASKKIKIHLSR